MKKSFIFVSLLAGLALSPMAFGGTPGANTRYAFPPEVKALDSVDFAITVNTDPGYDASVFWSNQFLPLGSHSASYVGMQSNGGQQRLFLLSAWGATDFKPGDAGSFCSKFTEGGEGSTCRMHVEWVLGHTYKFHIAFEGDNWMAATITDVNANRTFKLGSVKIAASKISTGNMSTWTEYFEWSSSRATCMGQPYSKVTLGLPQAMSNGAMVTAHIASTVTSKSCPDISLVTQEAADSIQENALGNSARGAVRNANGLCLDQNDALAEGAKVSASACTGKPNQAWVVAKDNSIQLRDSYCLTAGNGIVVKTCVANAANQSWKSYKGGIINTASQLCLSTNGTNPDLSLNTCDNSLSEGWSLP
ncbi:hypothetical protein AAKU55_005501 [Oxalobacteraceae bacterium GrIS 1.11]